MDEGGGGTTAEGLSPPPQPSPGAGPGRGNRIPAAILDQGVAAGTNLLIMVVAARSLDTADFGFFGLLYAVYLLVLGSVRALAGEPTLVQIDRPRWREDAVASALLLALTAAALVAVGGIVAGGSHRSAVLVLAVLLPGLILQDIGRYAGFAAGQPGRALRLDVIWAALLVLGVGALALVGERTTVTLLAAWGASGGLAGLTFAVLVLRRLPVPSTRWIRRSWRFSWRYFTTFSTTAGITYLTAALLGAIAGLEALGTVRAVQIVFGPLNVAYAGVLVAVVPEGAGDQWSQPWYVRRLATISAGLAVVAAAVTVVALNVPDSAGRALLGDTWPSAREILVPAGVVAVLASIVAGAEIGLRAARAVSESLRVHLTLAPAQLVLPLVGASLAAAAGYTWGLAAATTIGAVAWWWMLGTYLRKSRVAR